MLSEFTQKTFQELGQQIKPGTQDFRAFLAGLRCCKSPSGWSILRIPGCPEWWCKYASPYDMPLCSSTEDET